MERYFRAGVGPSREPGRQPHTFPSLSEISHSGEEVGGRGAGTELTWPQSIELEGQVLGRERDAVPEEEPQRCLHLSPFLPPLRSDSR